MAWCNIQEDISLSKEQFMIKETGLETLSVIEIFYYLYPYSYKQFKSAVEFHIPHND